MQLKIKPLLKPLPIILFILLLGLFLLTRFIHLTSLPVFVDEAIYVRWAQVMKAESTLRFLPLSDGKQPLFMWLVIPAFKLFSDPLFAGRFVSIVAGLGTLIGLLTLSYLLTSSFFISFFAGLFYIFAPYTLFFDRMALVDSTLSMFGVWSLVFGTLLVNFPRLDLAMILGYVLGGALLTKSPALFFVLLQPLLLLQLTKKPTRTHLFKLLGSWLIAGVIAFGIYNILRLGPNFHLVGSRNQDYLFTYSEVLSHPLNPFTGNFKDSLSWIITLISLPLFLLIPLSFFNKKTFRFSLSLFLISLLPFLAQAAIAKVYTPRYLLFTIPPLLLLGSLGFKKLFQINKPFSLVILAWIFFAFASFDYPLLFNVTKTPFPQRMAHGYLQEWTAGFGQQQIADYLIAHSEGKTLVVGTEGFFGTLPDGLQIYTQGHLNITVIGLAYPVSTVPESLTNALDQNDVYLVVNQSRNTMLASELDKLELISQYDKPPRPDGTHEVLQFYRLKK